MRRRRGAFIVLSLGFGFVGFLLLIGARTALLDDLGVTQWVLDAAAIACVVVAVAIRIYVERL